MRFVDYILSHIQYNNILNYCVINPIMWCLVSLVKMVLDSLEVLLNAAFAMFGFIYSPQVIKFIKPWIGWLWVPIALSILVLGINLIINNNDIIEKGVHKKFIQNFCLLMIVVCLLPAIFIGTDDNSASNVWGTERNTGKVGDNGVISIFTSDDKKSSPFWDTIQDNGNAAIGSGENNNGSMSEVTIANHVIDLQYVYLKYGKSSAGTLMKNNWSETAAGGKPISTDSNSYIKRSKGVWDDIGNSLNDLITPDKSENEPFKGVIKDINSLDPTTNNTMFLTKKDNDDTTGIKRNDLDPFGSGYSTPSNNKFKQYDDNCEVDGAVYLFYSEHAKHTWGEGNNDYTYTSKPMDKPFMDWYLISNFPHRYYVDWGLLLVDMIIQCIIIIGMSYKVVSIIFELAFSQFFAILVAATDLTNGQRTKEVLKIIMSLILTVGFTGVLFQFYRLATNYINGTFTNDWIRLFFTIFVGMACIKGTTVLSKVLGIGDGGGVGKQLGALAGLGYAASKITKPVMKTATKGVKKVAGFGFAAAGRASGAAHGAWSARKQRNGIGTTGGINTKTVKPGASSRGATPINGATANAQANKNKPNTANPATANANKPDTKGKAGEGKSENTAGEKADTNAVNAENSKPLIGGANATNTATKGKENGTDSKANGKADDKAQGQNAETEKDTKANVQGENGAETKNAENTDIGGTDAKGEIQAENNSEKSDNAVSGASNENAPANANVENEGAVISGTDTSAQGKAESENSENKNADIGGAEMGGNAPATANAEADVDSSKRTAEIGASNSTGNIDKANAENGVESNTGVEFANADNKPTAHTDTEPTIGGMESNTQTADGSGSGSEKDTVQIPRNESNMQNVETNNAVSDVKRSNADISQANAHSEVKQTESGSGADVQGNKPNFDTPTASVSGAESTAQNNGRDNSHTDIASSEVNSNKPVESNTSYSGIDSVPQNNTGDNSHADIASSGVNGNKPVESNVGYNGADSSNTAEYGKDRSAGITEANANVGVSHSESGSDGYNANAQSEKSNYDVSTSSISRAESAAQNSVSENANADMASYNTPTAGVSGTESIPQYSDNSRDSSHADIASSGINSNQSAESNTASYNGTENVPQHNTGDNSRSDIASSGANGSQPFESGATSYNGTESFDTGRNERSNDTSRFNEADSSPYSDRSREVEMPEYDSRGDYRQSQHNADAQQYAEDNFATIRNEYADRMQAYENKHSRTLLHPWRSENSRTGTGYYEEARRAAGETQGNILDDAMNRMSHDTTLDTRSAINETLVDAGYSPAHADMISRDMANSGAMDMHRQELQNQVSELAQQTYISQGSKLGNNVNDGGTRYAQSNDEIKTQGEYYRDAAYKVLSDRGIDSSAYAETLGNSVCVRDNYQTIQENAQNIRENHNAMNPQKKMSIDESFTSAVEQSDLGINGEVDKDIYTPTDEYSSSRYSNFGRESSLENNSRTYSRGSSGYGKRSGGFAASFRHSFSTQKEKTEAKRIDREENGMRHYEFNKHENDFKRKNKKR